MDCKEEGRLASIKEVEDLFLQKLHGHRVYRIAVIGAIKVRNVSCRVGKPTLVVLIATRSQLLSLTNILPEVVYKEHFGVENTLLVFLVCAAILTCHVLVKLPFERHKDRLQE